MSFVSTYYHFVFRTKRSMRVLTPLNSESLFRYINGICSNLDCNLIKINCMPDHVHLAVCLSSSMSVATFMREVKRGSSAWMQTNRQSYPHFEGWATGYFCSTFSRRDVQKVVAYIDNQQKHHLGILLYEEMRRFFEESGLSKDLEYFFKD